MGHVLDDLARGVARQTTRRQGLQFLATMFSGMALASIGAKSALGQSSCGTCQTCNDFASCGGTCPPGSGDELCGQADQDGSYIRLANFLTKQGYSQSNSSSVLFYSNNKYQISTFDTVFSVPSTSETAELIFTSYPSGAVEATAFLSTGGVPTAALTVDPNGVIVETVSTQNNPAPKDHLSFHHSEPSDSSTQECSQGVDDLCESIANKILSINKISCPRIATGICGLLAVRFPFFRNPSVLLDCSVALRAACSFTENVSTKGACHKLADYACLCPFNVPSCNGACCGYCQECMDESCVASTLCGSNACCGNNQCCQPGEVCEDNICVPSSSCGGSVCGPDGVPSCGDACYCYTTAAGGGFCGLNESCDDLSPCGGDGSCPDGTICLVDTCCENPICFPIDAQCSASVAGALKKKAPRKNSGRRTTGLH